MAHQVSSPSGLRLNGACSLLGRDGEVCEGAAEPARAGMAGGVLQLRRAQGGPETHPASPASRPDLHSYGLLRALAVSGVHEAQS